MHSNRKKLMHEAENIFEGINFVREHQDRPAIINIIGSVEHFFKHLRSGDYEAAGKMVDRCRSVLKQRESFPEKVDDAVKRELLFEDLAPLAHILELLTTTHS